MNDSTVIELGILAVLVFVVTHPVAPVVNTSVNVNNIPPPASRSAGDSNIINEVANGLLSIIKLI